ncbi:hypothetical protein L7F22_034019 [Adiantum nelumboides]|nr:hypothetical protein [Adiantum nelumboides]
MASVILESGFESEEHEEPKRDTDCKRIVDKISVIYVEKQIEEEFMDSSSEDLPLLGDDLPLIEANVESSNESQSERKYVMKSETPIEHATLFKISVAPKWSDYIIDYLTSGILPEGMRKSRVRRITKEVENHVLIDDNLYRREKDDQLRMCATKEEHIPILEQAHSGQAGGHFSANKTGKAILVAGIWWPTLFMDAEEFVKRCDDCQRTKTPRGQDDMPLRPMMGARAFAKWGIDFIRPIAPLAYRMHAQYIIVDTIYLTKWVEAKATAKNDAKTIAQFLYENIFTRYGLPIEIVSDRGTYFINEPIEFLLGEFMVIHQKSAPYHPQANGQAESTNKILVTILTNIVSDLRTDWDQKLHSAI